MTTKSSQTRNPGRNEPCPCGSGKKYKQCCALKTRRAAESPREVARSIFAGRLPLIALLAIFLVMSVIAMVSLQRQPAAPVPELAPGPAPQPWHYDAANDRHWDPDHGHWHDGPPPVSAR